MTYNKHTEVQQTHRSATNTREEKGFMLSQSLNVTEVQLRQALVCFCYCLYPVSTLAKSNSRKKNYV